jgi:hypothetical protein
MSPPPSLVVLEYLDLDTPALALPTSSLDSAERERAARFHFDEDRRRFIHGRAWLRLRVAELLGIDPKAVEFTTIGERGWEGACSRQAQSPPSISATVRTTACWQSMPTACLWAWT